MNPTAIAVLLFAMGQPMAQAAVRGRAPARELGQKSRLLGMSMGGMSGGMSASTEESAFVRVSL